jgi:hypothetical protein
MELHNPARMNGTVNFCSAPKVVERLAHDLRLAFPEMQGFSRANLMYMRAFAEAWPEEQIVLGCQRRPAHARKSP